MLVRACRCRQWVKNGLVVIAPAAAGALGRPRVAIDVCVAFASFCLLSSATYLVNDVRDRERDRRHPRKRHRPIAAGELAPRGALRIAVAMAVLGVLLSLVVRPLLAAVAMSYLALTTSYSIWWRNVVIADVAAVAAGFLLRAIAGGVAAGVALSAPFLIVTFASAVFLITGKRYAELGACDPGARATLGRYSRRLLAILLTAAAAVACVAYARWALGHPELGAWSAISLGPFLLWLGRYALLVAGGAGEAPEELILRDPGLVTFAALWLVLFLGGAHAPG